MLNSSIRNSDWVTLFAPEPARRRTVSDSTTLIGPRGPETPNRAEEEGDYVVPVGFGWRCVTLTVAMPRNDAEEAAVRKVLEGPESTVRRLADDGEDTERPVRLKVELWVNGSKRGACREAERRVDRLTADRPSVRVTGTTLRQRRGSVPPTSRWHMYRIPTWGQHFLTSPLKELWVAAGGADVQRSVRLPITSSAEQAEAAFKREDGGGVPFEEGVHSVRRGIAPAADPSDRAETPWWNIRTGTPLRLASILAIVVCGWVARSVPWPWTAAFALPLAAASWYWGKWLTGNAERSWLVRFSAGSMVVLAIVITGYFMLGSAPSSGITASTVLFPVGAWLAALGSWHACRSSRVAQNAVALSPVLILPLPWVIPFFAQFLQSGYLHDNFGIPTSAVSIDPNWTYLIALRPAFFCACVIFICLGMAGWARYFYWNGRGKAYAIAMIACVAAVYLLTIIVASLQGVSEAASRAADSAVAGRDPDPYFGINGNLFCIRPVVNDPAVTNGPLPKDYPVLVFERAGDEVWAWDPRREVSSVAPSPALHVKADHVTTWAPTSGERPCAGDQKG
ncbi:hypothetical protein [Streptomyces globisporus]|uniref:hypothetical protein n=1 Tax=Streptomyces globisporus TaxID=1908 RepID=UPI0037CAECAA